MFQGEQACSMFFSYKEKYIEFGDLDGQDPKLSDREKQARRLCKTFLIENCPNCSATKRVLVPNKDSDAADQTMTGSEIKQEVKESKVRHYILI